MTIQPQTRSWESRDRVDTTTRCNHTDGDDERQLPANRTAGSHTFRFTACIRFQWPLGWFVHLSARR